MGFKLDYKQGDHLFLCGKTGTGKSYGLIQLINNVLKKNYIIFDVKHEDFNKLGAVVVRNYKEFLIAIKDGKDKILIQDKNKKLDNLEKYLKFVYENIKNVTFIVDELHLFITKMKISQSMHNILCIGRSKGKAFWGASQRTQNIHNDVLSQSTHKFSFYLGIKNDREKMYEELDLRKQGLSFDDLGEFECFYKLDKGKNEVIITKF